MKVLIWDSLLECKRSGDFDLVIVWQGSFKSENSVSILKLVEESDYKFRERVLRYFYDLGEIKLNGKKVSDLLSLDANVSFWWMTRLSEKRNFDVSKNINHILKLVALEDLISSLDLTRIEIQTSSSQLSEVVKSYCKSRSVEFVNPKSRFTKFGIGCFYSAKIILGFFGAVIWYFYYILTRILLFRYNVLSWKNKEADFLFVSYFNNIDTKEIETRNNFKSGYWGLLTDFLKSNNVKQKWIHIWTRSNEVGNLMEFKKYLRRLNEDSKNESHVAIDSFYSFGATVRVCLDWFAVMRNGQRVKNVLVSFHFSGYKFWPLIQDDFYESFYGRTAIKNLVFLHQFKSAFNGSQAIRNVIYLQENQIWEISLISQYRKFFSGNIIGYPNTVIRFWDLRYFHYYLLYRRPSTLPMPNFIVANGVYNKEMLLKSGLGENMILEAESLRYEYLSGLQRNVVSRIIQRCHVNLLVLGDYLDSNTESIIAILKVSKYYLDGKLSIHFKPHPSNKYPIELKLNIGEIVIHRNHLSDLLDSADIVLTSCLTSAALDSFIFGCRVVSVVSTSDPNLSPLRGVEGVIFVSSADEFDKAISTFLTMSHIQGEDKLNDFFYHDLYLRKWRKILNC